MIRFQVSTLRKTICVRGEKKEVINNYLDTRCMLCLQIFFTSGCKWQSFCVISTVISSKNIVFLPNRPTFSSMNSEYTLLRRDFFVSLKLFSWHWHHLRSFARTNSPDRRQKTLVFIVLNAGLPTVTNCNHVDPATMVFPNSLLHFHDKLHSDSSFRDEAAKI